MFKVALLHPEFEPWHLDEVLLKMETLGPPEIRALWVEGHNMWFALEGCHRLRAAAKLGLSPIMKEVEWSPEIKVIEHLGLQFQDEQTLQEVFTWMNYCICFGRTDILTFNVNEID